MVDDGVDKSVPAIKDLFKKIICYACYGGWKIAAFNSGAKKVITCLSCQTLQGLVQVTQQSQGSWLLVLSPKGALDLGSVFMAKKKLLFYLFFNFFQPLESSANHTHVPENLCKQ